MALKIAVTGKGGTGKTSITTFLAKLLAEDWNYKLLLIDGDPTHPHLSHMVDLVPDNSLEKIRQETIHKVLEEKNKAKAIAQELDFEIYNAIEESKQFSVLSIGQPQEPGCFCPSNALLKKVIESLSRDYDIILLDCEAGLEQINRMVLSSIDYLLIVVDMSRRSIDTAESIRKSAKKFTHYKYAGIVVNKVKGDIQPLKDLIDDKGFEIAAIVPYDEDIVALDLKGTPLIEIHQDAQAVRGLRRLAEKIVQLETSLRS
ncbi:MAG: AAA family ATPase [Promethearchaeia archaeon]